MKIEVAVDYSLTYKVEIDIDISKFDLKNIDAINDFLIEEATKEVVKILPPGEVIGWEWDDSFIEDTLGVGASRWKP